MKLKEFITGINKLIDKEPNALELEVCYASDDEGNNHELIHFSPSLSLRDESGEMMDLDEGEYSPYASIVIVIN